MPGLAATQASMRRWTLVSMRGATARFQPTTVRSQTYVTPTERRSRRVISSANRVATPRTCPTIRARVNSGCAAPARCFLQPVSAHAGSGHLAAGPESGAVGSTPAGSSGASTRPSALDETSTAMEPSREIRRMHAVGAATVDIVVP
jgi:hypothetical protein